MCVVIGLTLSGMCRKKLKLLLGYRESCAMLVLCGVIVVERASNVKSVFTFKWWFSVVAIKVWQLMRRVLSHTCNECYSVPCNVSSQLLLARQKLFVTCNVYLLSIFSYFYVGLFTSEVICAWPFWTDIFAYSLRTVIFRAVVVIDGRSVRLVSECLYWCVHGCWLMHQWM